MQYTSWTPAFIISSAMGNAWYLNVEIIRKEIFYYSLKYIFNAMSFLDQVAFFRIYEHTIYMSSYICNFGGKLILNGS